MPSAHIVRSSTIARTSRVLQLEGLFDIPPSQRSEQAWDVSLPVEDKPWSIGLIVGPSGSGKSTVAREMFGEYFAPPVDWPTGKSVVESFPQPMSIKDITALLSSVGFSSPPAWLRPFGVLSTGEQFRVSVARALADDRDVTVIDEFTSVVDRTVAQFGSAAVAKTVRRAGKKLIAVTCHYDVEDWLQPDWVYQPHINRFQWRELQRRPEIAIDVVRVGWQAWGAFRHYHYLDTDLNRSALCFMATVRGIPAAFVAALNWPDSHHPDRPNYRLHRLVCAPDFQGVGVGSAVADFVSSVLIAGGKKVFRVAAHPAVVAHCRRSPAWRMYRAPSMSNGRGRSGSQSMARTAAIARLVAGFQFVGPAASGETVTALMGDAKRITQTRVSGVA